MKILAFSTKQNIKKKKTNVLARFSESKGGHDRVWNKILYVTRGESSWFFPRVGSVSERKYFSRGCVSAEGKIFSLGH